MSDPREIELKLEASGPDIAALATHPLLQTAEAQPAAILTSTYFDTADGDLRANGLTLRVRLQGGNHVQTVKAASATAGLFDRAEWEGPIEGPLPDVTALAETPAAAILSEAKAPELVSLFATVVERTTRRVSYGASRISATLDQGRIETPVGDAPLCELELELEEGAAGDLLALAQALSETAPLRLGALSKGDRGFAMIDETLRRPRKAGAVTLEEGISAGEAFRVIALSCLRHLRINEDVFLHGRNPEALHQIRVALRRLRSAFTLFKAVLVDDPTAGHLREEIKRVTEPFGHARNLDVFLSTTLPAEAERRPGEAGLDDLRRRLEAERERAYEAVLNTLQSPAWRTLILDVVTWLETGPWRIGPAPRERDAPAQDYAAQIFERARRRIKKRGRRLDTLEPEARHRVRIEAKKLRYGAEFFATLYTGRKAAKRHKAFVSALSDLQDHLGALNDLATAHEVAASVVSGEESETAAPAAFAAGLTAADGEARIETLLEASAEAHEELIDVKPFWR